MEAKETSEAEVSEEDEAEDEELYLEEFASLEQVHTPPNSDLLITSTPIKVKRAQVKGRGKAAGSGTKRTSKGVKAQKRLSPATPISSNNKKKRKRVPMEEGEEQGVGVVDLEEEEEEERRVEVVDLEKEEQQQQARDKRARLQALAEAKVLIQAYKDRELKQPKDPFLGEQLRQLVQLLQTNPKPRGVTRAEHLNKCALHIIEEDQGVLQEAEQQQQQQQEEDEEEEVVFLKKTKWRPVGQSGSQEEDKQQEEEEKGSKGVEEKGLLPLPKALQQKVKAPLGRPTLRQTSEPVEVGEGFVVYLASKRWGDGPPSLCLVIEKKYTREGSARAFSINVGVNTAMEIARVTPILIHELN